MQKGQRKHVHDLRRIHVHSLLVFSGKPDELDDFEKRMQAGEFKEIMGTEPANPVAPMSLPPIYSYQNKAWKAASLTGSDRVSLNLEDLHTNFHRHRGQRPIQARRYSLPDDADALEVAVKLYQHFKKNRKQFPSLEVHLDDVFQASNGPLPGAGGGGPTLREKPRAMPGVKSKNFFKQACFSRLGLDVSVHKTGGKGVTVAILDNSPELQYVDPDLVDFWFDLSEDIELSSGQDNPELHLPVHLPNVPEYQAKDLNRKDEEMQNVLDTTKMLPYHGTMIASLIRRLAPEATILLVKVLDKDNDAAGSTITHALEAVHYLQEARLQANRRRIVQDKLVINLSFGLYRTQAEDVDAPYMLAACDHICSRGAVIVACSGNDSFSLHPGNPEEPASYGYFSDTPATDTNIIAVAATDATGSNKKTPGVYAWFSNQSNIGAPGHDLIMDLGKAYDTTASTSRFVEWSGTSFAAPLVAGAAALLLEKGARPNKVKGILWSTALQPTNWNNVPELDLKKALESLS